MPMDWRFNTVIIPKHKLAIWTTEKVGCTSQKRALRTTFEKEGTPWPRTRDKLAVQPTLTARPNWQDYLRIAVVRDPLARIASCWANKITPDQVLLKERDSQEYFRPGMSFQEFVERVCNRPDDMLDRHLHAQNKRMMERGKFLPQYLFPFDHLAQAWNLEIRKMVMQHCNVFLAPLPRMNVSGSKSKTMEHWNPRLMEMVMERYSRDVELYQTARKAWANRKES